MLDMDTYLVELYVVVDDFCKTQPVPAARPGPARALSDSEVMTLGLLSQWHLFASERDFYSYAQRHLRSAFPTLPHRSQFNRHLRAVRDQLARLALHVAQQLAIHPVEYEVMDGTAAPVRNVRRRGSGFLAGLTDIGWSNRLGWYHGFHVLTAVTPRGVVTGFGFGAASTNDRRLAETFFALRHTPDPHLPSVGVPARGEYVLDKGFGGRVYEQRWAELYEVHLVCPPQRGSRRVWPRALRRWLAGIRQIIETVHERLLFSFGLDRDRPHELSGFQTRLAAKMALHNVCVWLNAKLDRPWLAFVDLVDW